MKKKLILFLFCSALTYGQNKVKHLTPNEQWVDSVYTSLTLEQRVGQLFMVAAYSNKNEAHVKSLEELVEKQEVGGVIFFQGGPQRQAKIHNRLQSLSRIPLLVGIDGEWGLSMRLDSTYKFPFNMTLGAVQDMRLIEELGIAMAEQAKRLGIHFNFGPVVDINNNAKNPIIGVRSYGETRDIVTKRALAFSKGYESQSVFATAKHFPGHGDTAVDSHHNLPAISHDKDRLEKIELYPYRKLIEQGLSSIMVAHLNIPAYEPDPNLPSSLSYEIVTKLLREEMGFEGLIFTDALNMKAAANYLGPGEVDLAAFLAGNDLLLFPENVPIAIEKIINAYKEGRISEERLAYSVKKILKYKYKAQLHKRKLVLTEHLVEDLNAVRYDALNMKLYNEALTVLKNSHHLLPIKNLEKERIAYISLGDDQGDTFLADLRKYANVTEFKADSLDGLEGYSRVIIGYHKVDNPWRNHDYSANEKKLISDISKKHKVVLVSFAKAYALSGIPSFSDLDVVIQAYQNNKFAHLAAAQIIFGSIPAKGKLPVTINSQFEVGDGISLRTIDRIGFSMPANEGVNPIILNKIDSLAQYAIDNRLTPGMQIMVAKNGKVIYDKAFGYHSYKKESPVLKTDLYDLASLTKILGTLPVLMEMFDKGDLSLETKLGEMLPEFKGSDKEQLTVKDLLSHHSGLPAWIPFYKKTLDSLGKPDLAIYNYFENIAFPTQVAENLYIKKGYTKEMLSEIRTAKLSAKKEYKYSDLGFILLKEFIEKKYNKPLDQIVDHDYYNKIGATRLTYLPQRKFDISEIPPTEEDNYYRFSTVQGYVHDMGAAMQGGVAGHAGLFGTALDVTKMMQLFLNKGKYGEDVFFSTNTFNAFNVCIYCNKGSRRGIGFDKPQMEGKPGPTCGCASRNSFGHTGFTGTMAWADPDNDLIYVFLSNRTYPDSTKNNLSKENIRENIQKIIYESIE